MYKLLVGILLSVTVFNLNAAPATFHCDGKELLNKNFETIYTFSFSSECNSAIMNAKRKLICADRTLLNHRGDRIYSFSFSSECRSSVMNSKATMVCAGKEIYNFLRNTLVTEFTFSSECRNALVYSYKRFICNDRDLYNDRGQLLRSFSSKNDCRIAMRNAQ